MRSLVVLVALAACHGAPAPAPGTPEDLAAYLAPLAGADEATRRREVTSWILDEAGWRRTVVEPYGALWPEYARAFDAVVPTLVEQLATRGPITARRHFAGDPRLTRAQARLRWAVPVQYPSVVVELAGSPIDTVFVHDGAHWRVLAGLDPVVLAHVHARDPECGARLALAGPPGRCTEIGWLVVDAALRGPEIDARFAHACQLARTLCGNEPP